MTPGTLPHFSVLLYLPLFPSFSLWFPPSPVAASPSPCFRNRIAMVHLFFFSPLSPGCKWSSHRSGSPETKYLSVSLGGCETPQLQLWGEVAGGCPSLSKERQKVPSADSDAILFHVHVLTIATQELGCLCFPPAHQPERLERCSLVSGFWKANDLGLISSCNSFLQYSKFEYWLLSLSLSYVFIGIILLGCFSYIYIHMYVCIYI